MRAISYEDVLRARDRIAPHLRPTPLRHYPELDAGVGSGVRVLVKHENHQPTQSFKIRNGLSAVTALSDESRRRGVVAASRGNHGQGVALAGSLLSAPVTICVPAGNSPGKNRAMRGLGAEVVEQGRDYDESVEVAQQLVRERGLTMIHSTNNPDVIAGAGTLTLEIVEEAEELDAMVVAVGGGSQAVGALTVLRERRPELPVFGVQAERASAIHDGFHAKQPVSRDTADTIADGLATRHCYEATFETLCAGLTDFVTVSEAELADAIRLYVGATHNLAEPAGAAGLAGLRKLTSRLAGKTVAVVLSGANIDEPLLRDVLRG